MMRPALLVGVLALSLGVTSGCDSKKTTAAQGGVDNRPAVGTATGGHPGEAAPGKGGRFPAPPK